MDIELRDQALPDTDAEVVIHMGTGIVRLEELLETCIDNWDRYINVNPEQPGGQFTLSVYIACNDEQEQRIWLEMRQNQFERARIRDIVSRHQLWPTTDVAANVADDVKLLHWDVVIALPDAPTLPTDMPATDWPAVLRDRVREHLRPALRDVLLTLNPRVDKRPFMIRKSDG